jgi:hypothetical protein
MDKTIVRALNLKPQDRFNSIAEFRSALTVAPVADTYPDDMTMPIIGESRPSYAAKKVEIAKEEDDKPSILWVTGKWLLRGVAMALVLLGGIQLGFKANGEKTNVLSYFWGGQQNTPVVYHKDSLIPTPKPIVLADVKPNPRPIVNPAPPNGGKGNKPIIEEPYVPPTPKPDRPTVRYDPPPPPPPTPVTSFTTTGVWTGKGSNDAGQKWVLRGNDTGGSSVEYISFSDGENDGYIQMNGYWTRSGSNFSNRISRVDLIINVDGKDIKLRGVEDMDEYGELGEKEKGQLEMILKIFDALEGQTINYRMENISSNRIKLTELSSGEAVYLSK